MRTILKGALAGLLAFGFAHAALAHGSKTYSAGEPGNPKQKARIVEITMNEGDGTMSYAPDKLDVKRGEQIKFVLKNAGALKHEFMLATVKENAEHGKVMEKFPNMEHDDPNGKSLEPGQNVQMIWKFSKRGTFEFACLIPGHHQAGMHGTVVVK